nr:MAG TPA: hypothetical protein [Caudoviricetes sp.]
MQNTAGSSCLGNSCTIIVQLFLITQTKKSPHSPSLNVECEDSTFHQASNGKDDKKIHL